MPATASSGREGARRDYGVVLTEDGRAVDVEATEKERVGRSSNQVTRS